MSKLIKRVIGEDVFDAEDYMADDSADQGGGPSGAGDSLDAEHIETTDEKREVQIANHIMLAAQNGDMQAIMKLAQELHDMHSLGTNY
jgi:hypothetical protein